MLKHTKIVATISDLRCDLEFLSNLHKAGMNVIRINTAHQELEGAGKILSNAREISDKIAILVDTKGPEVRTTSVDMAIELDEGDDIKIQGNPGLPSTKDLVCVNYKGFHHDIPVGQSILIDDGELKLKVVEKMNDHLLCKAENKGFIKSRKSVNVPGIHLELPSISDKDRKFIAFAIENDLTYIAHSFVRNKEDVMAVQHILDENGSDIKIIAKIENQEGVENIDEILDHAYGIMVARGDLGIEIPYEKIPGIQRKLIKKCIERKKPVIIATQMLHSMINNPRATRAEISDVASAIYSKTDAIMLSGETAYGDYPVESVKTMSSVAREVEKSKEFKKDYSIVSIDNEIAAFLANSAVKASMKLPIRAIVVDTLTGRTARYMAAFRGKNPVYAICYEKRVMRELGLSYGVSAFYMKQKEKTEEILREALQKLLKEKKFLKDDLILIIGGSFGAKRGANFMEICTPEDVIADDLSINNQLI